MTYTKEEIEEMKEFFGMSKQANSANQKKQPIVALMFKDGYHAIQFTPSASDPNKIGGYQSSSQKVSLEGKCEVQMEGEVFPLRVTNDTIIEMSQKFLQKAPEEADVMVFYWDEGQSGSTYFAKFWADPKSLTDFTEQEKKIVKAAGFYEEFHKPYMTKRYKTSLLELSKEINEMNEKGVANSDSANFLMQRLIQNFKKEFYLQ